MGMCSLFRQSQTFLALLAMDQVSLIYDHYPTSIKVRQTALFPRFLRHSSFRSDKYPQASEMLYPRRRAPAKRSSKGAIRLLESATDSCVKLIKTV